MIEDLKIEIYKEYPAKKISFSVPPSHRTIFFRSHTKFTSDQKFWLSFPRMKFAAVDSWAGGLLYTAFQKENLLYYPHLPNVYQDLKICMGSISLDENDIEKSVNHLLKVFWQSQFNCGTTEALRNYVKVEQAELVQGNRITPGLTHTGEQKILEFLQEWERKTKDSPSWMPDDGLIPFLGIGPLKE